MICLELLDAHTISSYIINCRQQLDGRVLPDTRPNCIIADTWGVNLHIGLSSLPLEKIQFFHWCYDLPFWILEVLLWERKITLEKEMSGAQFGSCLICFLAVRPLSSVDFCESQSSFDLKHHVQHIVGLLFFFEPLET